MIIARSIRSSLFIRLGASGNLFAGATQRLGRVASRRMSCSNSSKVAAEDPKGLPPHLPQYDFRVEREEVMYSRYVTLYNRKVQLPSTLDGKVRDIEYDIAGHPKANFQFAVTFPFHRTPERGGGEVTLVREYSQGVNGMMWALPTGGFEPRKHSNLEACARAEMSEEARLTGGEWVALLEEGHPGIQEVKWCANRFMPFLCIDPQAEESPPPRDDAEFIEIHRVSVEALQKLLRSGDMLLPSIATCYLALDRLQQRGLL